MTDRTFATTGFDSLPPPEMARRAEEVGTAKAALSVASTFALGVLAGAFIALGAIFATTVTAGGANLPYGVSRLLAGPAFSVGLGGRGRGTVHRQQLGRHGLGRASSLDPAPAS